MTDRYLPDENQQVLTAEQVLSFPIASSLTLGRRSPLVTTMQSLKYELSLLQIRLQLLLEYCSRGPLSRLLVVVTL